MIAEPDPAKPRSVFVEPFAEYRTYSELHDYAATALARAGYDAVPSDKSATYRLRSNLSWSLSRISLAVRLVDATTGQLIYFGECKNPGMGTMLAASASMADCFDAALSELK